MPEPTLPTNAPRPYPTRFGLGMRLFLCVFVFDMVFRGFSVMIPWTEWASELDIARRPKRLPTRGEMAEMRRKAKPEDPDPVFTECMRSADSFWEYFRPWPEPSARAKIRTWADGGKWGVVWMTSRLELWENILGINEEWPMFSPNVMTSKSVTRARLIYADGSERMVRSSADPEDLCHYSHWFKEKILDHELKVEAGEDYEVESYGYCNLLRHRHPVSESGSPLREIRLFRVRYELTPPGEDAREWMREQTGPPASQISPDFYVFDAKSNHGKCLPTK